MINQEKRENRKHIRKKEKDNHTSKSEWVVREREIRRETKPNKDQKEKKEDLQRRSKE